MVEHHLKPDSQTLHGDFSRNREPVLRIQPGDTVVSATLDAGWGLEAPHLDRTPRKHHPASGNPPQHGHALIGPVWIEGARPGMTLVVDIEDVIPGVYGFTYAGGFAHRINQGLQLIEGGDELLLWNLDAEKMTGINQHGHRLKLRPFLGIMGMPPPEDGFHSTSPPRVWGGNIDCKDLVTGAKLYLPIPVEGGLFSFGDGHAAHGHGEAGVSAIECPMKLVRLRLSLLDHVKIDTPRVDTFWLAHVWVSRES